jgi:hypothetical protein
MLRSRILLAVAALIGLVLPALAQTPVSPTKPWTQIGDANGNALGTSVNPIFVSGGGGGGGGAVTIADGSDTAEGATSASAYTDTTGSAAGTLTALNKGQFVKAEAIRTLLAAPLGTIGSARPAQGVLMLGSDGTNSRALAVNTSGNAIIDLTSNNAPMADGGGNNLTFVPLTGARYWPVYNTVFNGTSWDRMRGDTVGVYVKEQARSSYFAESTAALAANGTYQGGTRDAGVTPSPWSSFNCVFRSDVAGTGFIQISPDGTTWTTIVQQNIVAQTGLVLSQRVISRYSRCFEQNSTSAQTSNFVASSFTAN